MFHCPGIWNILFTLCIHQAIESTLILLRLDGIKNTAWLKRYSPGRFLLYIILDIVNRCRSLLESLGLIVKESKVFLSQHRLYPMLVSYGTLLTIQLQSHLIKFLLLKICAHLLSLTQFLYGYWKGP